MHEEKAISVPVSNIYNYFILYMRLHLMFNVWYWYIRDVILEIQLDFKESVAADKSANK